MLPGMTVYLSSLPSWKKNSVKRQFVQQEQQRWAGCIFKELGCEQANLSWHTPTQPPGPPHGQLSVGAPCLLDHPLCGCHRTPAPHPSPDPMVVVAMPFPSLSTVLCFAVHLWHAAWHCHVMRCPPLSTSFSPACASHGVWQHASVITRLPDISANTVFTTALGFTFLMPSTALALMVTSFSMTSQNVDLM